VAVIAIADIFGIGGRQDELSAVLDRFQRSAGGEPGCKRYTFAATLTDPSQFVLVSEWDSEEALDVPEMLAELASLKRGPVVRTSELFPIVLSVGERRSFTANDIFRDPAWRKQDADGRLRISTDDAGRVGLLDGERAVITTARGSAEATVEVSGAMLPGHASLPNGFGLQSKGDAGVAPNSLTSSDWRDDFAGTPWHKHVPARIERADVVG
jgi:anaerobic selenocysteine-containing dehydrogenase